MKKKEIIKLTVVALIVVAITSTFSIQGVSGNSMNPTFESGDIIVVMNSAEPKDGDVVVLDTEDISAYTQDSEHIIKRYSATNSTNGYYVLGDNPEVSYDSRYFGEVEKEAYAGTVVLNLTKTVKTAVASITSLFH